MDARTKQIKEEVNDKSNLDSKRETSLQNSSRANIPSDNINDISDEENMNKTNIKQENENLNYIIELLKIDKDLKTEKDIQELKDYLTSHYDYFKKLLKQSEERFLKLIPLLRYEIFQPNKRIMNFGDEGDKCYILLKGRVGIYKPFPVNKSMTLRKYVEYLNKVKNEERNDSKFERLLNYNSKIDKNYLYLIDFDYKRIQKYSKPLNVVLEEERLLAEGRDGISFGEMALIKNEPRNATIIALEQCSLISIEKHDYNKSIKDVEEQKIIKELSSFRDKYPIFKFWPSGRCFPLISGLISQELMKDEYVYKQNEFPNYIYIIKEGIFEISSYYNFETYERFIEYIHDTTYSLIPYIDNPFEWKEDKNARRIDLAFQKNLSPFIVDLEIEDKVILSHKEKQASTNREELVKNLEDELNKNKRQIYKTKIRNLYAPDIFGFIEALELKQRLTNIKCISQKGIILKFPLREFLQLLPNDKRNNFTLQQRIFEEKKYIITQLKNSTMAKLNFVKINMDKNLYIKKDFFLKKINKKNSFDLKGTKVIKTLGTLNLNNIFHFRLKKSNSSLFTKNSNLNNNSKFTSNESLTITEERINNLNLEKIKKRPKNIVINGFKKTLITLTKNKINAINNLYPKIDKKIKPSFLSNTEFKEKGNHSNDYINYLGNNIPYAKTTAALTSRELSNLSQMTGKKYISFEADKIINKINKKNKSSRKITAEETRQYNGLVLPDVNNALKINRSSKKNKSEIVKLRKLKFKSGNN